MPGLLLLNGGAEFVPGNEPQDGRLVAAAGPGPALVVPTAALRQRPELAVANARRWFAGLGLEVLELPVYGRRDAASRALAERAASAGLLYLPGGDPGLVVRTLAGSRVWAAIVGAWAAGAALAGSSAGAMALCERTLVMARWPRHRERRAVPALGLVPATAVLPHYDAFGRSWSLAPGEPELTLLGLDERTAALWDGSGWWALGAGVVTVLAAGTAWRFPSGVACRGIPAPDPERARRPASPPTS